MTDRIDKLAWLHLKDKQLLVARSKGKDAYYVPGGKREAGETDKAALIREIAEEVSVALTPETIKYVRRFIGQAHGKPQGVEVMITCYYGDFTGKVQPNSEIEDITFVTYEDKAKCSHVTQTIMDWLLSNGLIALKKEINTRINF